MANFVWVPVGGDDEMDLLAYQLTNNAAFQARVIPRADGTPRGIDRVGAWGDIAADDKLIICGHGAAKNTRVIGWKTPNIVVWTHDQLANELNRNLNAVQKAANIHFELFMCWSADSILWKDPFAYRLATDLGGHGFHGTVIGYKGSVIMYGGAQSIVVHGSGRFTSLFGSGMSGMAMHRAFQPRPNDPLYIDKFNHYDFSKQRRTWNIP